MVQEYISSPYLIEKKKFDLRVYVMVTDVGTTEGEPVLAFIANEALVRFCTLDYEKPSGKNMHKLLGHLTNYSLNKLSTNYKNCQDLEEVGSKMTLQSIFKKLSEEEGIDCDHLFDSIKEVCAKTMVALQPYII